MFEIQVILYLWVTQSYTGVYPDAGHGRSVRLCVRPHISISCMCIYAPISVSMCTCVPARRSVAQTN